MEEPLPATFPDAQPDVTPCRTVNRATEEGGAAASSHEDPRTTDGAMHVSGDATPHEKLEGAFSFTQNFEDQLDMELAGPQTTLLD